MKLSLELTVNSGCADGLSQAVMTIYSGRVDRNVDSEQTRLEGFNVRREPRMSKKV